MNIDRVPLSKVITCSFFQPKDQSKLPGQAEIHLEKHSSGPEVAIASLLHSVVVAHEGFVGGPSCETAEKAVAHVMSVTVKQRSRSSRVASFREELCEHGAMGRKKRRASEHHDRLEAPTGSEHAK